MMKIHQQKRADLLCEVKETQKNTFIFMKIYIFFIIKVSILRNLIGEAVLVIFRRADLSCEVIGCAVRLRRSVLQKVVLRRRFSRQGKAWVIDSTNMEGFLNIQSIGENLLEWSQSRIFKVRLTLS